MRIRLEAETKASLQLGSSALVVLSRINGEIESEDEYSYQSTAIGWFVLGSKRSQKFFWTCLNTIYRVVRWFPVLVLLKAWGDSQLANAIFGVVFYDITLILMCATIFFHLLYVALKRYSKDTLEKIAQSHQSMWVVIIAVLTTTILIMYFMIELINIFLDAIHQIAFVV